MKAHIGVQSKKESQLSIQLIHPQLKIMIQKQKNSYMEMKLIYLQIRHMTIEKSNNSAERTTYSMESQIKLNQTKNSQTNKRREINNFHRSEQK